MPRRFGQTSRRDAWWIAPALVFLGLSAFIVYATWAGFQGKDYRHGPYVSPFYSPEIFGDAQHSWFGPRPDWWPGWLPWSPAFIILWVPAGFRLTCYYFRGAYYKAFWADPPSCTVGEPRHCYRGERFWPLLAMNIHRYFLYLALVFMIFLVYDVWQALWFEDAPGQVRFGVGVGTLVLAIDVVLLSCFVFGCHALRHLVGGRLDEPSKAPVRFHAYRCASCLNRRHMFWAWISLFWVGFADVYVRLCSMGVWTDWRII